MFEEKVLKPVDTSPDPAETAPEMTAGAVDIMSATMTMMLRLAQGERCDQSLTVYDGKRRFNLVFSEIQFEKFPKSDYGFYEGGGRRCDMSMETLAGKWRKNQFSWVTDPKGKMMLSIWLAPLTPGGVAVPVRARTYGEFGTVFIHLHNAVYNGQTFGVAKTEE